MPRLAHKAPAQCIFHRRGCSSSLTGRNPTSSGNGPQLNCRPDVWSRCGRRTCKACTVGTCRDHRRQHNRAPARKNVVSRLFRADLTEGVNLKYGRTVVIMVIQNTEPSTVQRERKRQEATGDIAQQPVSQMQTTPSKAALLAACWLRFFKSFASQPLGRWRTHNCDMALLCATQGVAPQHSAS